MQAWQSLYLLLERLVHHQVCWDSVCRPTAVDRLSRIMELLRRGGLDQDLWIWYKMNSTLSLLLLNLNAAFLKRTCSPGRQHLLLIHLLLDDLVYALRVHLRLRL